jgi:hypothetical protein
MAWAGEEYQLKWDILEKHLEPDQYAWFFKQPLYRVQLVLDTEYRATDQRWIKLVAEFFDPELEAEYRRLWAK